MSNEVQETAVKQPEIVRYEYGDFTMECGKCGKQHTLFTNDKGGRSIEHTIFTTDAHEFRMGCEECGNFLRLYYVESVNPPAPEEMPTGEKNEEAEITTEGGDTQEDPTVEPDSVSEVQEITQDEKALDDEEPVQEEGESQK
jgi:hypothetical protein